MEYLVWIGAALSVIGLIGIFWSVRMVQKARRANLPDDQLKAAIQKALPVNLGAFMISALGLAAVVAGVLLS